jgi:hypothetical protein
MRTLSCRTSYIATVKTVRANDIRIPDRVREAVARHEEVVVLNRDRPAYVILNPDDHARASLPPRRGRPLKEVLGILASAPLPDPSFAEDMEAVRAAAGVSPPDPWEPS